MKHAGWKKWGVALLVAMAMSIGMPVAAQQAAPQAIASPAAGLGSAWPNAQDVSKRPEWHVYVFVRDGVKYIQVNDVNGVVRGGVAASITGDTQIALPLGMGQVGVATDPAAVQGPVVYSDNTTVVSSTSTGLVASPQLMRAADCTSVPDCSKLNN